MLRVNFLKELLTGMVSPKVIKQQAAEAHRNPNYEFPSSLWIACGTGGAGGLS